MDILNIDIENMLHKDPENLSPSKGDILIADPMLKEPYFRRSVVLIMDKTEDGGHMGLVLNVATPVTLQDLFPDWKGGEKVRIFSGGPVETDRLFMLHSLGHVFSGATEIAQGLYVGGDLDEVIEYINSEDYTEGNIRFFLGYSGWSTNQLSAEILGNSWAVGKRGDMSDALIGQGNDYWMREVGKMGEKYRSWLIVPQNPEFN